MIKTHFVKGLTNPGKTFNKFSTNVGQGLGSMEESLFIRPIQELTGTASGFINSPIWYIALAGGSLILLTAVVKSSSTANKALENPESIRALGEIAQQLK
jgi:hypothetical protein